LKGVDKFILYFRNTRGFERYYGIHPDRVAYVPFKVNGWGEAFWPTAIPAGEYVLCAGRTLRDLETFVAAMQKVGVPGVLLQQSADVMQDHGTIAWARALPANVRLQMHDGRFESFLSAIANAKAVVIPRFKHDICSTGISTYLVAMALGKAVIISRGPGADDLLRDEAVMVEPENTDDLATAIDAVWSSDAVRERLGARARQYAQGLGGSARLNEDILRESLRCLPEPLQAQRARSH